MKLWGGRFTGDRGDPLFEKFSESFSFDQRLVLYDLRVNRIYVRHLAAAGVLSKTEAQKITQGLESICRYIENHPTWARNESSEDVHTWVEDRLEKEIGPAAKKLRTGRSRNDLVATETRLFVKDAITDLLRGAMDLLDALLARAKEHLGAVMPGYTHLQPAQPILFSHYLLAYFEMFTRDVSRLVDCRNHADELPLGAGALAGTAFAIDRAALAQELDFSCVARNSLDATSDRDFVCELLFACALIQTHLSRLAEDLILYSSPAFGYVELSDQYSTGSSLMPQKKNADSLELIRGKAARVIGRLTSMITLLKGLPLAYDRDLQEDKVALFDGVDTVRESLILAARIIRTLSIHEEKMKPATQVGFLTATDVADELVRKGIPFAKAHEQTGKLVRHCIAAGKTFAELSPGEARQMIPSWDARLARFATSPELSIAQRNVTGGTARAQVARQIEAGKRSLTQLKRQLKPSRKAARRS
ncbi:MAG TPA: argininosuccinate lyase [Terriglobia bacterium]|nr:argininosuccinate lyase [Terriglobia bacterium]